MRTNWWGLGLGLLLAGTTAAQPPVTLGPPVVLGPPVPGAAPLPLPSRTELPPPAAPPPAEFGVGIPVSPPVRPPAPVYGPAFPEVRPPMPVSGAPVEEPPDPRFWVSLHYILWRARGDDVPPLLAVSIPGATVQPQAAIVSDGEVNHGPHNGVRLAVGYWLTQPQIWGVEASYWWMNQEVDETFYSAPIGRVLSRPFVDARTGQPTLFQLSTADGTTSALARVQTSFDTDGLELNLLRRATPFMGTQMHWVMGLRYWGLREDLTVETTARSSAPVFESAVFDRFATLNRFFGAQVGTRVVFDMGKLSVVLTTRTALGAMYQEADISGGSSFATAAARESRPGGFLALAGNSGEHSRTTFALLGDLSLSLNYRLTDNVTLGCGYNLLLVNNVVRPGGQISPLVNPSLLPFSGTAPTTPVQPTFDFVGKQFWMHGINVGMVVRF
jgi:hypothetical protein